MSTRTNLEPATQPADDALLWHPQLLDERSAPTGARGARRRKGSDRATAMPASHDRGKSSGGGAGDGKQTALGAGVGALGGAAVGAGIGLAVGGPIGALIGAGIGLLAGGIIGALLGRRTVTVNVSRLDGAADTTSADFATANQVFRQAGVSVVRGSEETVSAADTAAILGGDGILDEYSSPALTAEETLLVARNRTAGRIAAYWVPALSAGSRGEAITPGFHGVADPSVVVSASARAADTFAHELGHCLIPGGHHADPNNLMAAGAIRNFTDQLTEAQINTIKSSPYVG